MMKRKILKGLFAMAMALYTMGAIAAGKVEVTGDTSHGEVTSKVNGAVVTLTVTPYSGYYIRKSDITVKKTYMPTASSPRRSVPISDILTLVGADPEDLSQSRDYTVTMPSEEYDLLVELNYTGQQVIKDEMVTLSETVFVYNGQVQYPTVSVAGLTEGKDYTVTYNNPSSLEPGTYTITVEGYSTWQGAVQLTYKIFIGGKAEVNTSITGGTIATAVDGLKVTLTVTPANGYYIRKQDVAVAKTFMPVAEPQRRIALADQLPLEGDDPEDLSLPRTYTTQLPGWEYSAYVDATFQVRQTIVDEMVKLSALSFVYNGSDQKPIVTVTGLTEGKDYILTFEGNSWSDAGSYSLSVTGRSTWQGTVNRSYTISKAASVVTLVPAALSLVYTGAVQQLVKAGDATGGTLLYSRDGTSFKTTIPTGADAGSYTVYYMVQGDANHYDTDVSYVSASIGKKDLTVKADDKSIYHGMELPELTFEYDGFVNGENEDVLTIKPDISTTASAESAPGEYSIIVKGGEATNYTFSYINAILTIKTNDLTLDETADNDNTLTTYNGRYCNVTLQRTLQIGGYNTFAVPFSVSMTQLKEVLGNDVKVKELVDVSLSENSLTITFADATGIEAGRPYLIKVSETVSAPVFEQVVVNNTLQPTETFFVDFIPTVCATTITGDNVKSVLFIGAGNKLHYPTALPANIKGFRGFFQLKYDAAIMASSYSLVTDDSNVTNIKAIDFQGHDMDGMTVHNLNGQLISVHRKGLHIIGRKKIVIK